MLIKKRLVSSVILRFIRAVEMGGEKDLSDSFTYSFTVFIRVLFCVLPDTRGCRDCLTSRHSFEMKLCRQS